jgi:hypothetical protein
LNETRNEIYYRNGIATPPTTEVSSGIRSSLAMQQAGFGISKVAQGLKYREVDVVQLSASKFKDLVCHKSVEEIRFLSNTYRNAAGCYPQGFQHKLWITEYQLQCDRA